MKSPKSIMGPLKNQSPGKVGFDVAVELMETVLWQR